MSTFSQQTNHTSTSKLQASLQNSSQRRYRSSALLLNMPIAGRLTLGFLIAAFIATLAAGLIVDDAHDLSLEYLMLIKEVTDQGHLQYGHPLGLCLVAAGRGATIPLKETLDLPDPTWLQFRRRLDKLDPFCRIAGHTSEEVREILAAEEGDA